MYKESTALTGRLSVSIGSWSRRPACSMATAMIVFVLTGGAPLLLVLTLLVMCYLTGYELWRERDLPLLWKAWWVLFVFLTNIFGFGMFWIWLALRRRRHRHA